MCTEKRSPEYNSINLTGSTAILLSLIRPSMLIAHHSARIKFGIRLMRETLPAHISTGFIQNSASFILF